MTINNGIILATVGPDGIPLTESIVSQNTTWTVLKNFITNNLGCQLNYIDNGDFYFLWCTYRGHNLYIAHLVKNTSDCTDFETTYKNSVCNIPEATQTRLSTCRFGRKLSSRYISFTTATPNGYNNNNYLGVDFGDVIYTMADVNQNVVTDYTLCTQTWIDWEPTYCYEIAGGSIFVPTLPADLDLWALYVIAAPDYPESYGGSLAFISNPHLKWVQNQYIIEDESLNPCNVDYVPGYHFTKVRWIIKHPIGAQVEFQINMRIFK